MGPSLSKAAGKYESAVYQIKVTLAGTKPPVWRSVQLLAGSKLSELHRLVQTAMGWFDCHLHEFTISGQDYGLPYEDDLLYGNQTIDERRVRLNRVVTRERQQFSYRYDFGDNWIHTLVLEKILPSDPSAIYPICVAGKRNCPPEDCGGIYGYLKLLDAVNNPMHEDHRHLMEWVGGHFDPEAFSVEHVNRLLHS